MSSQEAYTFYWLARSKSIYAKKIACLYFKKKKKSVSRRMRKKKSRHRTDGAR